MLFRSEIADKVFNAVRPVRLTKEGLVTKIAADIAKISEYQTEEGEAQRNDDKFCHVAAWEWTNDPMNPTRHAEELVFETAHLATRSYK